MNDGSLRMWQAMTSDEAARVAEQDPVVILPLAAIEQHGPHLPLSTDLDIGLALIERAGAVLPDGVSAWVLPAIAIGASEEHAHVAGTLSVRSTSLVGSLVEQGEALAGAGVRRLVLANSHGGNRFAMDAAGLELRRAHGMLVVKASWFRLSRPTGIELPEAEWRHGLHGGAIETSMMMRARPELVREDRIAAFPSLGEELESSLRRLGPEGEASFSWLATDLNPQGVVGDATRASPELGERLLDHYARGLADVILDARDFPLDRLRPPPAKE